MDRLPERHDKSRVDDHRVLSDIIFMSRKWPALP